MDYPVTDTMGSTIQGTVARTKGGSGSGGSEMNSSQDYSLLGRGDQDSQWSGGEDTADSEEATFVKRNNGIYEQESKQADAKDLGDRGYGSEEGEGGYHRAKFSAYGRSRYEDESGESRLRSSSRGLGSTRTSPRSPRPLAPSESKDVEVTRDSQEETMKAGGGGGGEKEGEGWSELQDGRARSANGGLEGVHGQGGGQSRVNKTSLLSVIREQELPR